MLSNLNKKKIQNVIGKFDSFNDPPYEIFEDIILEFLNEVSKRIFSKNIIKKYADIFAFGFWCRKSNIKKLKESYFIFKNRFGRGTVLHITPSNVPTNFAYSLAFGLLAGNQNIVRIPTKKFYQVKILCEIINSLLKKKKFQRVKKRIIIINYKNSDDVSNNISKFVDARVIWGGDETIKKFKTYETLPRCLDLTFANRFSISLINSNKINIKKTNEISLLANKFYNDTYTMDQFGCSSPTVIFWIGKNQIAKKKFWLELEKIVDKKYEIDLSATNKKISNLTFFTLKENKPFKIRSNNFNLIRLSKKKIDFNKFYNISFGSFHEVNLKNINLIKNYASSKVQTMTYYGFEFEYLKKILFKNKIKGIDRVVPIGPAFDLTSEWDGIDVITSLSRTIGS